MQADQVIRESAEIYTTPYTSLVYYKARISDHLRKNGLVSKWCWDNRGVIQGEKRVGAPGNLTYAPIKGVGWVKETIKVVENAEGSFKVFQCIRIF